MTGPEVLGFRELVREVPIATHVREMASAIVMATHPQWDQAPEVTRRFVPESRADGNRIEPNDAQRRRAASGGKAVVSDRFR